MPDGAGRVQFNAETATPGALGYVRARLAASGAAIYLGEGSNGWVVVGPERSALVLGPPRSGKTTSVVIPSVAAAPGPVLSTSTKPDVVQATASCRQRVGRTWIFDPAGSSTGAGPGLLPARWSPVAASRSWAGALAMAHSSVWAARPADGADADHWVERASALLGTLLHAAALEGAGIDTVLRWVNRRELAEAADTLHHHRSELASDVLAGIAVTDHRERSGIFSTAASTLAAYNSSAALASASPPHLDPARFVESRDTIYVCFPAHEQRRLAPLVASLVDALVRAAFLGTRSAPPLLLALDEVANMAPLRSLPSVVAEGGSQGVVTLACLQDLSQARPLWGPAADGLCSLFSHTLVLAGIRDLRSLELVAALAGRSPVPAREVSRASWPPWRATVTTRTSPRPRLEVDAVARGRDGHGLLIGPGALSWVRLTPWYSSSPWPEALQ